MAPPSDVEVFRFIDELISEKTPDGKYAAFEWRYLLDATRRHFKSSTPAISQRMEFLHHNGYLAPITVTHGGYVRLTDELSAGMWMLYFRYHAPSQYSPEDWGLISSKRTPNAQNLWANGSRLLFTTRGRFDAMVAHFTQVRAEYYERQKQKETEKDARFWELLESHAPDARELLARLKDVDPKIYVNTHLSSVREDDPSVDIDARSVDAVVALLNVLRRGLPPKE